MSPERSNQRLAVLNRLNGAIRMKGKACLMDAGSDWIDNLILELEEELRRKEG